MDFANHLKAKNNANPFLMQIKNVEVLQANSCSNSTQVCVYFEYLPHTLQDLINRNHIFSEVESTSTINSYEIDVLSALGGKAPQ